jgi:hypothetical protein
MAARRVPMQKDVVGVHPCRSEWGYQWMDKVPKALHEMTLKAATRAGLDVGALDVLRVKGEWVLLEVNTAPAVDARSIREFFTQYLPLAARAKYPYLSWSAAPGSVPPVLGGYRRSPLLSSAPAAAPYAGGILGAPPVVDHAAPVAAAVATIKPKVRAKGKAKRKVTKTK